MEMMVWNAMLTLLMALLGWAVKVKDKEIEDTKREIEAARGELGRVTILLNRTREEVAKEYVTKADVHNDINRVRPQTSSCSRRRYKPSSTGWRLSPRPKTSRVKRLVRMGSSTSRPSSSSACSAASHWTAKRSPR